MRAALRFPDGEIVRNSRQHLSPQGIELSRRHGAAKGTAIVRAGHPALDAALTSDANRRYAERTVAAMRDASRLLASSRTPLAETPAASMGRTPDGISVTTDRQTGTVTTIHTAVTRSVLSRSGRRFELRVWRELAQQSCN